MTTFDQILPITTEVLTAHSDKIGQLEWLVINRDLNGRVRFIAPEQSRENETQRVDIETVYQALCERLASHAHTTGSGILYEASRELTCQGASLFTLSEFDNVWVVDRLATEANWAHIAPETEGVPRIVFFSIKGGVGRSTALAATAWRLAQEGKRVLVLDLDLESPGLSSALLPPERQPMYGITDWLVEDLVDNGNAIFDSMVATSNLSHDGEIHVVPAHGADHGEYIAKLGRVWMPKLHANGSREMWSARLMRLLEALEARIQPDVVLIDSRSGIDEIASACITDMGATLILLFALEGKQTWNGYRMLFEQWQRAHVAEKIRERLKVVGAIVPELDPVTYLEGLRESAYEIFADTLYDEIAPASPEAIGPASDGDGMWRVDELVEGWSFDEADDGAPHYPWAVNWHRSFAGLRSLQGRLATIGVHEVQSVFGQLIDGLSDVSDLRRPS
ncbi:ParA family protein [Aeromonas salmonicida]|uniref:ArsA-related P-loop ATPase n=1 Tax=Aeromonas salmonicida TaxID=645 RepID=A0AAX3VMI9_AERSA|nr:ArsA-related P-loop ATPase [Aeromonas salmonicida]WHF34966.1 ArsA-related P-loop ATPase [Aeromonas salmonicida]